MTQDQCLQAPSHWTHLGVCYPGSNATIQLHGISMGGQVSPTSVPEPSTFALFALALVMGLVSLRIRDPAIARQAVASSASVSSRGMRRILRRWP